MLIHLKRNEDSLFLFETNPSVAVSELIPAISDIYNSRLRVQRLISATQDLVEYGPLKPIEEQGYTDEQLEKYSKESDNESHEKVEIVKDGVTITLNPDPTGRRTGHACSNEYAQIISKTLIDAENVISKNLVAQGKPIKKEQIEEAINNIRGAITIAYPMNLPEGETVRDILEDQEDLAGKAASKEVINTDDATIWWAGKELSRGKLLSDYVGKNDKSKIIAKIQKKSQGAPIREAPMSEQAQKEMMAYYYRKQEQHKKLIENDDDDYVNSPWADSKALKSHFNGIGNVKWGV